MAKAQHRSLGAAPYQDSGVGPSSCMGFELLIRCRTQISLQLCKSFSCAQCNGLFVLNGMQNLGVSSRPESSA